MTVTHCRLLIFDFLGVFFMEKFILLTNNDKVQEKFSSLNLKFIDGDLMCVLTHTRDLIHQGHKLLSHPLSGSIKPNETPFKSVLISEKSYNEINYQSLTIIEEALQMANSLIKNKKMRKWPERIIEDFSIIDLDLISSAIESAN